ncbi:MAG: MoxR family ATPase, partial [Candidatus Omnitrophica bacterium]|nr:MoxR family ATPase [Candidatus Omnitrophota bacterium]MBU1524093.1 MoxR family ATPase [Candidatus Omnitrophota bacterium]
NRTTPRTQSSLLECMQEHKVTLDGQSFPLDKPFMVIATQNPIEFQGTFPLPEAQIDRFLMKIGVGYPSIKEEIKIINEQKTTHPIETISAVLNLEEVKELQEKIKKIEISEKILNYIVSLVSATRKTETIKLGASPRASIALMQTGRAWALLEGRDYVIPDDIYHLAFWVLGHRIILDPKASMAGLTPRSIISNLLNKIPII